MENKAIDQDVCNKISELLQSNGFQKLPNGDMFNVSTGNGFTPAVYREV
jgi:hypothetical protein